MDEFTENERLRLRLFMLKREYINALNNFKKFISRDISALELNLTKENEELRKAIIEKDAIIEKIQHLKYREKIHQAIKKK